MSETNPEGLALGDEKLDAVLSVQLSAEERDLVAVAARSDARSRSGYARNLIRRDLVDKGLLTPS